MPVSGLTIVTGVERSNKPELQWSIAIEADDALPIDRTRASLLAEFAKQPASDPLLEIIISFDAGKVIDGYAFSGRYGPALAAVMTDARPAKKSDALRLAIG